MGAIDLVLLTRHDRVADRPERSPASRAIRKAGDRVQEITAVGPEPAAADAHPNFVRRAHGPR